MHENFPDRDRLRRSLSLPTPRSPSALAEIRTLHVAFPAIFLVAALGFAVRSAVGDGETAPERPSDLALVEKAQQRVEETIAHVRDAVVTVGAERTANDTGEEGKQALQSGGSGVIISPDGFLL